RSLASEFELPLDQRTPPEAATFYLDSIPIAPEILADELTRAGPTIAQTLRDADASPQARTVLDNTALSYWISNNLTHGSPHRASALTAAFRNRFGTSLESISALALLYLFTEDDSALAFPSDDSPVFVARYSNQSLIDQLTEQTRVQLGYALVSVAPSARGY